MPVRGRSVAAATAVLHATTKAEHEVEGRLLLDVVIREGAAVLELLAGKDQALLVEGGALLVLDLGLDVADRVRRLDLEGDRLACERLDKDLHATTGVEPEVKGRLLLGVVYEGGGAKGGGVNEGGGGDDGGGEGGDEGGAMGGGDKGGGDKGGGEGREGGGGGDGGDGGGDGGGEGEGVVNPTRR